MGKFRDKLIRFMYGRYGSDQLNLFLLILYIVILVILSIIGFFAKDPTVSTVILVLRLVSTLIAVYSIYRMFSRKIHVRMNENRRFLELSSKFKGFFKLQRNKFKDRKTHIYRKCPKCKAVLRLKRIKGSHRAVCPRCSNSLDVYVR